MEERRHSLDIPISKALLALRRVRSLRDPSTNSMSKLCAPVDNMIWDANTGNSITLAIGDSCVEKEIDHKPVPKFNDLHATCRREGANNVQNPKVINERDSSLCDGNHNDKGLALTCISPSRNFVEGVGSCNELGGELSQGDSLDRYIATWKTEQRKQSRSYRMVMGEKLSDLDSPCLISHEGLSGTLLIGNEDLDYVDRECGWGLSSCFSGTPRFRDSNRPFDVENQPLLTRETCETELCREGNVIKYLKNDMSQYSNNNLSVGQKFKPRSFSDLVGQNVVSRSLLNAISSAKITTLYIFHGPRGTGKTSASKIFAAALNCLSLQEDKPCGLCRECVFFFSGKSRDVMEVDSVRINHKSRVKSLIKHSIIPPISSRFKVFIIDECHFLQHETWSTLLNKLDDLPRHVVFLMITPDLTKLPQSAILQSERYHFPRINEAVITGKLEKICKEEGLEFERDALLLVANKSNGSLRDAEMTVEHLSLIGKKITMLLVYELIGIVSDDDLLELLDLALSSDSSKTIRRARELMGSGIDPMQLMSQLANLVMDVLAGKCDEGSSEIRKKFFRTHSSEASLKQLSNALKILSEAEKQLKMSKCQATWLTVALLQFNSIGCSFVELSDLRSCERTAHQRDGDFCSRSSTSESLKHGSTCDCHDKSSRLDLKDNKITLQNIWKRAIDTCQSSSLKCFLKKKGNLSSVCFNQGVAVAQLEFLKRGHVKKAEKSWKVIANALQTILGCNVEIRIILGTTVPTTKSAKTKKPCPRFFNCSRKSCEKSPSTSEFDTTPSNISKSAAEKATDNEKCVQTCSSESGTKMSQNCCLGNKGASMLRSIEGNALSIEMRTNGSCEDTYEQVVEKKPYWFARFFKLGKRGNLPNAPRYPCERSQPQKSDNASSASANPSTEAYLAYCT